MDLKDLMQYKKFVVVGDTLNEEKYASKIKNALLEKGYEVFPVYKEIKDINEITDAYDVLDLCINPVKGLQILKSMNYFPKAVIIQPGAESEEIITFLKSKDIPYLEACVLVGLKLYTK